MYSRKKTKMCFITLNLGKDLVIQEDMVEDNFSIEAKKSLRGQRGSQRDIKNETKLHLMVKFPRARYVGR